MRLIWQQGAPVTAHLLAASRLTGTRTPSARGQPSGLYTATASPRPDRVSATLGPHTLAFSSAHVCSRGAPRPLSAAALAAGAGSSAGVSRP